MRINSITAAALGQYQLQALTRSSRSTAGNPLIGIDTATFSPQAHFLADQGESVPTISNAQAAKISDLLRRKDPTVFARIDGNHDDKLSASEITTSLRSLEHRPTPIDRVSRSDDVMAKVGERLQKRDPTLFADLDTDQSGKLASVELTSGSATILAYFSAKRKRPS